jgi:hypothetical protein
MATEHAGDDVELGVHVLGVGLGEDRADRGGDHLGVALGDPRQDVASDDRLARSGQPQLLSRVPM